MTLILNLSPDESRRVASARAKGINVDLLLHGVLASLPSDAIEPVEDKTLELLAQWRSEDEARLATMTPEEIAAEDVMWDEIQHNIENPPAPCRRLFL